VAGSDSKSSQEWRNARTHGTNKDALLGLDPNGVFFFFSGKTPQENIDVL
jgi:hypothetical protein